MRPSVSGVLSAVVFAVPCTFASAQVAPLEGTSLPYFDIRLDADGLPTAEVREAIASARSEAQRNARAENVQALQRAIPGLRVGDHEFFDTPYFVRSTLSMLTEPAPGAGVRELARAFIASNPALFEIAASEIDSARVYKEFRTRHNGVQHLILQQQIDGVDIWDAMLKINVTAAGEIINVASHMLPRPAGGFDVQEPEFGSLEALRIGAANVGIEWTTVPTVIDGPSGANHKQVWGGTPDFRADEALTTELVYFARTRTEIVPAWSLVLAQPGIGNTYEVMVDALDGTVLRRWNRLHFAHSPAGGSEPISFRVFASDSPTPFSPGHPTVSDVQPAEVPRDFVTLNPGDVFPASPDHWIDDGGNETFGNNVASHTDLNADNIADLPRPQGSPYRVFDFALNLTQDPSTYTEAAVTNMFYHCNVFHDRLHDFGWDEAASNFQDDNFGLGGIGGDRLEADSQDGTSFNNANFNGSGADGSTGRIQMFNWDGPNPNRDGDFDAEIIYHEYAHGLSIRLSNGTVSGSQSGGMGEGWGDYFGLSLLSDPGDDLDANYAMGGYAVLNLFGQGGNFYWGIRRFPFSTDMSISPLTYADLDPAQFAFDSGIPANSLFIGNPANEVHNVGEIWTQALLEVRKNMIVDQGFGANDGLMQLVVDGLKLQPNNPNMLDARDAILQADLIANGGINAGHVWEGFAKRGMGSNATSPAGGSSTSGIVEDFTVPTLILFDYTGLPSQLAPDTATPFSVVVSGLGGDVPTPGTGNLHVQVNGGGFQVIPMNQTLPNEYTATLPSADCFDSLEFYVSVDSSGGVINDPPSAPAEGFVANVFTGTSIVFADDFENALGWVVGDQDDDATTGIWERVDPVGTDAQPEIDVTDDPGTLCFVTGQGLPGGGLGDNDIDGGKTTLFSPLIDLSSGDAVISYYRWYSNTTGAEPNADVFEVDISNNAGVNWTSVEVVGPSGPGTSGGWVFHEFVVSDFVAPTSQMLMRFIASDEATGSLVEAGLDEFSVDRLLCETCQEDVGFGGPGVSLLTVCGDALTPTGTADALLVNAPAAAPALAVYGFSNLQIPVAGGILVPSPDGIAAFVTDGSGEIFLPGVVGSAIGPAEVFVQFLIAAGAQPGGAQFSNALRLEYLP